jgi:C1A family cysteine protease
VPLRNLSQWKSWLAIEGPILTRLDVDSSWMDLNIDPAGKLDEYKPPSKPAGHAVTIVGYNPERFIVRNSWGTEWGDKGFAYASLGYAQEAFRFRWSGSMDLEAYGIKVYKN